MYVEPLMWADWTMPHKIRLIQSSAVWTIPTACDSLCNNTLWTTVQNAADKSRSHMMTRLCVCIARRTSFCTQTRAASTLLSGLYAEWLGSQTHVSRQSRSNNTFYCLKQVWQIGHRSIMSNMSLSKLGFLIIGLRCAPFKWEGITCVLKDMLTMVVRIGIMPCAVSKQPYRYGVKFTGFNRRWLQKYSNFSFNGWLKYSQ